ncbi:hypothetical protein L484_022018 [Morus notabilis]|uniref:Uncharacterized protein n=1 Tax=Morus notabilis TaxID=981085 RepID=W9RXC3_9ROSA|nr:hypothetical protein L484_022018 [Morus notabilis]
MFPDQAISESPKSSVSPSSSIEVSSMATSRSKSFSYFVIGNPSGRAPSDRGSRLSSIGITDTGLLRVRSDYGEHAGGEIDNDG